MTADTGARGTFPAPLAPPADPPGPGAPPAGAIQRAAAETLEVLAEHLSDQLPVYRAGQSIGTGLLDLLASHAQYAADAHQIPWSPWNRDGIETAALLGLSLADLRLRRSLLRRENLARHFVCLSTRGQRAWLLAAADLLHATGNPDAYGPPTGENPAGAVSRA